MAKKKAVCLLSGGLDSCVTTYLAKKQGYEIYALSVHYGQRHTKEIASAKKIAKKIEAKNHVIIDVPLHTFGASSLLATTSEKIKHHRLQDIGKKIPSTYVPARNTVFLSLALAYAETIMADAIFIGVTAVDYSGYPDCRPQYLEAFQHLANLATKRGTQGKEILINAPLIHLTKAKIILTGIKLNAPLSDTWSCYNGRKKACGRCDSCLLRLKGFQDAKTKDPLLYETLPTWYKKTIDE